MQYVLLGLMCGTIDPTCIWKQHGLYQTEERCVVNALAIDPKMQFKCIRLPHDIPLPRARPIGAP